MKKLQLVKLTSFIIFGLFFLSSCTEKETTIKYGFLCTNNLFTFVDITLTYISSDGENITINLTPAEMDLVNSEEQNGETLDESYQGTKILLNWGQHKTYKDDVHASIILSYSKKEGVDYSLYKGKIITIINQPYIDRQYYESGLKGDKLNVSLDLDLFSVSPDVFYGDNLENYIDDLVTHAILKYI